ncbi:hypothetical protein M2132_000842 [Dysgonomonas sp. PH5-45]|uniref:T9SS type A sorting domain-containing protein n=1 Tax=unclassified Dysgonomonas TaxID=2630389 RepID=UPI002472F690|nr:MULTISPECIES: T9SS type A sorting domain-containing protein [unclassified Dysgonomonas]MDH6354514.1 hypothetical protein [Dysgonomonas sp. PH5-45]MDH6387430.1 hypothetical protein [Dysgonomonas sp. PH5-37]
MKQKLFLLMAFLAIATVTLHAQTQLIVKNSDGRESTFGLSSLRKITFTDTNIEIHDMDGTSSLTPIQSTVSLKFAESVSAGIETDVAQATPEAYVYPNPAAGYIRLNGLPDDADYNVKIYTANGMAILSTVLHSASDAIDVGSLPSGLYLLKVNNQVFKFRKL